MLKSSPINQRKSWSGYSVTWSRQRGSAELPISNAISIREAVGPERSFAGHLPYCLCVLPFARRKWMRRLHIRRHRTVCRPWRCRHSSPVSSV